MTELNRGGRMAMAEGTRTGVGPGRLLIAVYAFFALAAGARAGWQLATRFEQAPVAYLLSATAAAIYLVAAIGLARQTPHSRLVALVCCGVELAGVLVVGTLSLVLPDAFPRATVWSEFGIGYGFVPLLLPMLGLLWLRHTIRRTGHSGHRDGDSVDSVDSGNNNPVT